MYILAASSPNAMPSITAVYTNRGWAQSNYFKNGKEFYGLNCLWDLIMADRFSFPIILF